MSIKLYADSGGALLRLITTKEQEILYPDPPSGAVAPVLQWEESANVGLAQDILDNWGLYTSLAGVLEKSASPVTVNAGITPPTFVKTPVAAATVAALATNTRTGNVLTASANGALAAIDGYSLAVGDSLLVKNEATGANNGIYTVTSLGSAGTPWVLTRHEDADVSKEVLSGIFCFVENGLQNIDTTWVLTTADPITLNTTALTFTLRDKVIVAEHSADHALGGPDPLLSPTNIAAGGGIVADHLRGYIDGLILSHAADAAHDIIVATGAAASQETDDNPLQSQMLRLTSALTKRIDAIWAAGNNAGGLFTGTVAADTWYYVFLIRKDSNGTLDAGFEPVPSPFNLPTGYSIWRRLGAVKTDGSANILAFKQHGDDFLWKDPPLDVDVTNPGTSAVLRTLSVPTVLHGVLAKVAYTVYSTAGNRRIYLSSPDVNDEVPSFTAGPLGSGPISTTAVDSAAVLEVWTNSSGQIRSRLNASDAATELRICTLGWRDPRGKNFDFPF